MKKSIFILPCLIILVLFALVFSQSDENYSWWCGDPDIGGYADHWLQFLDTPDIELPSSPSGNLVLTFKSNYNIEPGPADYDPYDAWDGINVRISLDAGATFEVLEPIGGYPWSSMYGFGYNGEGESVPGWGGSSSGWVAPVFNMNSYIGETVRLRFAFGSDPAFSTVDDGDMFGWIIDEITIRDDEESYFYNGAGSPEVMTANNGITAWGDYWEYTDEDAHSPTHSWNCPAGYPNLWCALVSPVISVPTAFDSLVFLEYWIYCDFEDLSGSGEGLDDYIMVFASPDSGESFYWLNGVCKSGEYEADSFMVVNENYTGNVIRSGDVTTYGTAEIADSIRETGQIQLYFIAYTDDNDDMGIGEGVFIDDVLVKKSMAVHNDILVNMIGSTPTNFGEASKFSVQLYNNGLDPIASIPTFYKIFYNGTTGDSLLHSGLFSPFPSLASGEFTTLDMTWTPPLTGDYTFLSYCAVASDEVTTNDSLEFPFHVYAGDTTELGYDDGETNPFDDDGHMAYLIGPDLMGFDYAAVHCTAPYTNPVVTHVRWWSAGTYPVKIEILSSIDETPGDLIATDSCLTATAGEWVTADIEDVELTEADFFITLSALRESTAFGIYADTSSPVDERSWLLSYPDLYNLDNLDFLLRAVVTEDAKKFAFGPSTPVENFRETRGSSFSHKLLRARTIHPMVDEDTLYFTDFEDGSTGWTHIDFSAEGSEELYWHADTFMHYAGIGDIEKVPFTFDLKQNYPNPFNAVTTIAYSIAENSHVKLEVYDIIGKQIISLVDQDQHAGAYEIKWNCKDEHGSVVPAGVYFYRINAGDYKNANKMLLLK